MEILPPDRSSCVFIPVYSFMQLKRKQVNVTSRGYKTAQCTYIPSEIQTETYKISDSYSYFTNDRLVREAPVTVAYFLCHNL